MRTKTHSIVFRVDLRIRPPSPLIRSEPPITKNETVSFQKEYADFPYLPPKGAEIYLDVLRSITDFMVEDHTRIEEEVSQFVWHITLCEQVPTAEGIHEIDQAMAKRLLDYGWVLI